MRPFHERLGLGVVTPTIMKKKRGEFVVAFGLRPMEAIFEAGARGPKLVDLLPVLDRLSL